MSSPTPHRISLAAATAIVVATMVGTGVFTSLGFQIAGMFGANEAPSGFPILMLWVVGGVVALCGALSYAEFTSMMPRSGGEYHLMGQAYHPLVGFLAGWVSVTAGFSAPIAATSILFGEYMHGLWPQLDKNIVAYAIVALLTLLQLGGVSIVARFQVSLTVIKVLMILGFIAGAYFLGTHPLTASILRPQAGDTSKIFSGSFATSLVFVMYAYAGWNGAVYVAGDMKNPQRNLPLALLFGTLIVMVLYVGINAIFLMGGDWNAMRGKEDVAFVAARGIFTERGSWWMGALIAFGLLSTANAILWTGAAVLRVIGQDMWAMCWLDATDRRGEPVGAVLFMTNLVLLLLGTGSFQSLVLYIQALLQLCSLMVVVAVVWWRIAHRDRPRPYKVPLYPLPPLIFIAVSLWMLFFMVKGHPTESLWGALTLVIGVVIYFVAKLGERATPPPEVVEGPVTVGTLPPSEPLPTAGTTAALPPAPEKPVASESSSLPPIAPFPTTPPDSKQP